MGKAEASARQEAQVRILLDTDIASSLFARRDERLRRRFLAFAVGDVASSAITAAELAFGSALNGRGFRRVPGLRVENWLV